MSQIALPLDADIGQADLAALGPFVELAIGEGEARQEAGFAF